MKYDECIVKNVIVNIRGINEEKKYVEKDETNTSVCFGCYIYVE